MNWRRLVCAVVGHRFRCNFLDCSFVCLRCNHETDSAYAEDVVEWRTK